jgi:hypothetical protein
VASLASKLIAARAVMQWEHRRCSTRARARRERRNFGVALSD